MIPVLDLGRAGIQKLIDKGTQMGDVMTGPQVAAAHKLALEQATLKTAMDGVTVQVGEFLMPAIVAVMGFIVSKGIPAIQQLGSWFEAHLWPALKQVWAAAVQLGTVLKDFLNPLFVYIKDNIGNLKPVLIAIGIVFAVIFGAVIVVIVAVVVAIVAIVAAIIWVAGRVEYQITTMKGQFEGLVGFIRGLPARISAAASGMWDGLKSGFKAVYNVVAGDLNKLISAFNALPHPGISNISAIPLMDTPGLVPGPWGSPQLVMARGGESFGGFPPRGGGGGIVVHNHFEGSFILDGPTLDRLGNMLAQRGIYATGR